MKEFLGPDVASLGISEEVSERTPEGISEGILNNPLEELQKKSPWGIPGRNIRNIIKAFLLVHTVLSELLIIVFYDHSKNDFRDASSF